ncbi:Hypothetical predicted protein, partial [Mytilus galloprovincialis]
MDRVNLFRIGFLFIQIVNINAIETWKISILSSEQYLTSLIFNRPTTSSNKNFLRYRWKLRYLYYIVKVKYSSLHSETEEEYSYMYGAFVSYADEDRIFVHNTLLQKLEVENGIQLCLHKRNFLPGNDIATNITSAIHNSRRTLVIMSHNFLKSYWCMFEYNMARMESIYERRNENVVFLMFYEQMSPRDLPLNVLEMIQSKSYIEYPNDEYGDTVFWDQCITYTIRFCITCQLMFLKLIDRFRLTTQRFRWKLRYLYYIVKVKYSSLHSETEEEYSYMYGAFVSYADEDRIFVHKTLLQKLEVENGIQLCLHMRNFLPGNDIATNIASAIHNSRKTLVIMSHNFLKSYWCMFEYNMARMENVYERRDENVVFLMFYEQMSPRDLPLNVLEMIQSKSYIEYPNDEYGDTVLAIFTDTKHNSILRYNDDIANKFINLQITFS